MTNAFESLTDLKQTGVLPRDTKPPAVARVEHRATRDDWGAWRAADVVVGTPNVLSDGYPEVERVPQGLFDLVIFDEAHHLPARVWTAILDAIDARALLLTATPTRRDGKRLAGDMVYSYPLSQAIADRVYAPVKFVPVQCADGADPDQALAVAAARRLNDPAHQRAGSRLLVRTGTQDEARKLVDVYAKAGVALGLVLADTAPSSVDRVLRDVREGRLQGFVAVGALIEGFDFPALKIAAYHRPHRSLAPTLQFVGRLSRVGEQQIRGELLAIPEQVEGETRELYRQDRDWADLMPEIVDAAHMEERDVRRYVVNAQVTGPLDIPPRALTPPRSARIYRLPEEVVPQLDVDPTRIGRADVVFRFYDAETSLLALVTHRVVTQRWAETAMLDVPEFQLHLTTWVAEHHALFISTESGPAVDDLLKVFDVEQTVRHLPPDDLVRLIYAAEPASYFSIGLRAAHARRVRGASYDMTAGPAVETALDYADRTSSILGHLMARPLAGNRGTLGFSVAKSKLWEPENAGSLLEFRRWAVERAQELDQPAPGHGLPRLDVQLGQRFDAFEAEVLGASMDAHWITGSYLLLRSGRTLPGSDIDVLGRRVDPESVELTLTTGNTPLWRGAQTPSGHVTEEENSGIEVVIPDTGEVIDVARAFRDAPVTLFLGDGSTVIGDVRLPPRSDLGTLPEGVLLSDEWAGVTITSEIGTTGTVQARTAELAAEGADWVATDHGSGELADFISLGTTAQGQCLRFFHCKGSGGASPGRRVGDLYEVIGQAVKNVPWTIVPAALLRDLARRHDEREAFRLLSGDEKTFRQQLDRLANQAESVAIEIVAVQPGVSVSDVADWPRGRALLQSAVGWCSQEQVAFRLLGSP